MKERKERKERSELLTAVYPRGRTPFPVFPGQNRLVVVYLLSPSLLRNIVSSSAGTSLTPYHPTLPKLLLVSRTHDAYHDATFTVLPHGI